jgi:hypothetical protein
MMMRTPMMPNARNTAPVIVEIIRKTSPKTKRKRTMVFFIVYPLEII